MSSAYEDIIQRIRSSQRGDHELAMKILSWVFHAVTPLCMDELLEALVVEEVELDEIESSFRLEDVLQDVLKPSAVIDCCKSLIIYEESSQLVRFTHFTVQEYITDHLHSDLPSISHLSKTCLTYLAFPEFEDISFPDNEHVRQRLKKYKFNRYAARYWSIHMKGESEDCPDSQKAMQLAFGQDGKKFLEFLKGQTFADPSSDFSYYKGQTFLHTIVRMGLSHTCKHFLHGTLDTNLEYCLLVVKGY